MELYQLCMSAQSAASQLSLLIIYSQDGIDVFGVLIG